MKASSIFLLCLVVSGLAGAQNLHLDLYAGAANYLGDLQDKNYTYNQAHFGGGAGLTYDISPRFSVRGAVLFSRLSADDKLGRNKFRNLNFTTNLSEFQLAGQFYILPLESHSLTPYIFGGIAFYHINPYTYDTAGAKYFLQPLSTEGQGIAGGPKAYKSNNVSIPFGGGVKLSLTEDLNVGIEVGFRKTFTDYIDDVSDTYFDNQVLLTERGPKAVELAYRGGELKNGDPNYPAAGTIRGNPKNKDMYYFSTLTLSYRLSSLLGERARGARGKYGCPTSF